MPADTVIDGDRAIEFINAVKSLGNILDGVNLIGVKEAFIKGKNIGAVENILELEKVWKDSLREILHECEKQAKLLQGNREQASALLNHFKTNVAFYRSDQMKEAIDRAKEFADVLDRLEHHRQNGTIELITKL